MTFDEFLEEWRNDRDFIEVNTSGSTGEPKSIRLPKKFARESAERTNTFFGLTEKSRFHSCVAADFIGGKMMAVRSEVSNGKFTWEKPSNNILKDVDSDIDLLAVVPSQMISLLERKEPLPDIKNIIIGGSSIHPNLRKRIGDSDLNAYETYGMTETASHIALRKVSKEDRPFKLLPGIKISKDCNDCLIINFLSGEEIRTNDICNIISETEFYILGRKDDIIISGGKKINPLELENKLSDIISTKYYFTALPDEKWGQKLVLVVEGERGKIDEEDLMVNIKSRFEKWQVPKEIYYKRQISLTANGKIKRNQSILS